MKKIITSAVCFGLLFTMTACGKNYEKIENELRDELETSSELKTNYFSAKYDTSSLDSIVDEVSNAIDKEEQDKYEELLKLLKTENEEIGNYIDSKMAKIYNTPTNSSEYPFAVDIDELPIGWEGKSIVKQTSKHPLSVDVCESDYSDVPPYVFLWIDQSSSHYHQELKNIETKEIVVETAEGKMQKALVNTEIKFICNEKYQSDVDELNMRPGYLIENKEGEILLALQNYDNKNYYVLYKNQAI